MVFNLSKDDKKSLFFVFIILVVLTVALFIIKEVKSDVTGASVTGSNIKQAAPTPTSCTRTQNCGSPGCGTSSGGSCGAATGGSCGG